MRSIVLDTNVLIAALRSQRRASLAILSRIGRAWAPMISTAPILDLAAAGRADAIVTHNVRHFAGVERFGIRVLTPREFLRTIEGT